MNYKVKLGLFDILLILIVIYKMNRKIQIMNELKSGIWTFTFLRSMNTN